MGIGASGGSCSLHGSAEVAPGGIGTSSHPGTATGNDSIYESSSDEEEGPQIGEGSGTTALGQFRPPPPGLQPPTQPLRLVKTVVTRWWSLYCALLRMLYLKKSIERFTAEPATGWTPLAPVDW